MSERVEREDDAPDSPPRAPAIPHEERRHGELVVDPYFWLRDRSDPRVAVYLEAENTYTARVMRRTSPLQEQLYREMLARIEETDLSVPERLGPYLYYTRIEQGRQYRIHCRRRDEAGAAEEVLLDENLLATDRDYFELGVFEVSPDHRLLAYSIDLDGSERYTLCFKDLATGALHAERIADTYDSLEWAADSRTVFYTTVDSTSRPWRLHRHIVGEDPGLDPLVHEEADGAFFLHVDHTKNRRFVLLYLASKTTTEIRTLDAATPAFDFTVLVPRRHGIECAVEQHGERWFVLTNESAINFKLMQAPVADPRPENWHEVVPHRLAVKLEAIQAFAHYLVLLEREGGTRAARIFALPDMAEHRIDFDEAVYGLGLHANPEFATDTLRFTYTSLVVPRSVFDYDMRTRRRELRKQEPVLGDYDPARYRSERVWATAPDGVAVPISLVRRADRPADTPGPLLLYGYGAYGISSDPSFESERLSLLDRGFTFAIAHIRGGGELGRPWYEAGKLTHKRNTFTDFIAAGGHLIAAGYTTADQLVLRGGSAGGLLVGAVANMRPDLAAVVVAKVPFVDVLSTMLDPTLPLTIVEWEEWGDPRERVAYELMRSYSPYDNVRAADYPHMLVTCGLHDPRVAYWEAAKWVAKLRALKTGDRVVLLKTNLEAGHGGPSGRYTRLRELAFEYAFILDRLGVVEC